MANNPTIVAASLSDQDLKNSIDKLVKHVDEATKKMAGSMDSAVEQMKKKLGELGNVKIDFGGTSSGGGTKKVINDQRGLEEQTKKTTQAVKEQKMTFDQAAQSQQAAIRSASGSFRNADTLQMMQTNLDLLKEKLRDARQQYSSFVALAAQATTTGDKGLYQFATSGVRQYEQEVKSLIPQIRSMQTAIKQMGDVIAPQGHTIQNYVNTIGKATPELKQLGEQIKNNAASIERGNASMSQATSSANSYTEAIRKQAQAIRESEAYKKGERVVISTLNDGTEIVAFSEKRLSLEQQIFNAKQAEFQQTQQQAEAEKKVEENVRLTEEQLREVYAGQKKVNEEINKRSNGRVNGTSAFQGYDNLRESIAAVLGLQKNQVKIVDEEIASYNKLSSALKQYKQAYYSLTKEERDSDNGKNLLRRIQEIDRAIQKIQSQASRPITLNSILGINGNGGLSEKTLDDIAYKMQRLASYRSGLDVDSQKNEIKQVNAEYDRLKKKMDEVMNKNQQMVGSNNALGRSWNYMKNRLAFYFTVGASTQFIKNLIEVRSQYEMNERALGILINSAERGTQIFNELSQMALVSPYTLIELSNAAKQLTAYDIAANEVVDTTRRLADMASAVGVPMERLTYALGQIKAYGYLNSRDARMFANAGIPLVRELSKYYTELEGKMVSVGDVYDRMKKKAIDYNDVMSVVTKMTDEGGKFFDFQAKMADTLKVRLANLTLAWNNMLNDIGKSEQGVLTTGINLLKDFFLRWKDINRAVEDLVIVFGVLKAAQLAYYGMVLGTNKAIAIETVLGTKLSNVLRNLGTTMSTVLTSGATWWGLLAVATGSAIVEVVRGNEAMKEFNKTLRENAKNTYDDLERFKEQYKELIESLYNTTTDSNGKTIVTPQDINVDDAKKAWEAVKEQIELSSHASDKYIGSLLQIKNISERLRQSFVVIDDIQSVSAAIKELGDDAIKLEREWSGWWNLWTLYDGTIGNLKDTHMWLGKIEEKYGSIEKARKAASGEDKAPLGIDKNYKDDAERWLENYENELKKFREDLESTKESILNFINAQGWSGNVNKVNETFKQITDNLIQQNQLDPEKAYTLQIEMEEARSKAAKEAQYIRLQDLRNAYMAEKDSLHKEEIAKEYKKEAEIYNNWNLYNGRQKVEWERFTKYLKEQHLSEMNAMFRGMNNEQIKSLNFQEGKYADWVKRMVTNYAKSHKMSYDEAFNYLKNWVASANQWSIFIPLTISTDENKTVMKALEEADAAADKAWKDMQRLDKEIARLRKEGAKEVDEDNITASKDDQKLTKALKERAAAEKDYNKAVSEGGESKKENTANTKAQKQAESELQKALKDELNLIDEVRSQYKKLTDAGVSRAVAMKTVTEQFGESISHINAVLGKNGMPKFDIKSFAGTDDPHAMMVMLKKQIDAARSVRNIKPEEISELEIKYSKIKVDADAYDATKIKKGLDNELGRLKDEYELAVELDANPELGGIFADMFDIDLDTLPRTAREYAEMYTKSLNKYFKKMSAGIELPNMLNLTRNDMEAFTEQLGTGELQQVYFDLIQKGYETTKAALKKEETDAIKEYQNLLQKYSEYQYKLTQITKQANNERKALVVQFGNELQKEEARKIVKNLDIEKDPQKIEELNKQLSELIEQVAGDNELTVQLSLSIDNKEAKEKAKALWDNFKNSDSYTIMFDDLKRASTGALNQLGESFEEIKPKIKESPEAMKELMNAYKQLREELTARDPFGAMVTSMERMRKASADVEIAEKELDDANKTVKKNEDQLALLRKTEPKNIKAIEAAEKNLTKAKKDASEKQKNLTNAQNQQVAAKDDYKKALSESAKVIDKLGQSISSVGSQLEGTSGQILQLIGDIMSFVKTVADGIISTSETASRALQAIETASVILMIISAAIKIIQQISSLLSDSYGEYEKFAEKQSEINKLKDTVVEYQMAVLEARMEEENWFSTSNLKKLKNYYKIGSDAIDAYKEKLFQAQAIYENESGSGWLTKLGAQANRTWASITGAINELIGIEDTFMGDLATYWAQFGWANTAGGMVGMNMFLENLLWNKKYDKSYEEGLIAAWQNLRIETREASKGFLGTGIGGHNQETRDLIEWAREELGMDLFLEDFTLNEEAYKVIMDKWSDKLVGETKETLEALHEYTEKWREYIEQLEEYVDSLYSPLIDNMSDAMWDWFDDGKNALDSFKEYSKKTFRDIVSDMMKTIMLSNFGNKYAEDISDLYTEYVKGGMSEKQLIEKVGVRTNELMDSFQNNIPVLEEVMNTASQVFKQYGIELKDVAEESSLSALQQGIQGITEDTAGAIEAYMNGISQQIYYQSDLLTEIRDVLVSGSTDIQAGVQTQMLFELQQSYQVQMAIQNILDGWSSPNGQSVRVEMIN